MELFSLEDDGNELFITQISCSDNIVTQNEGNISDNVVEMQESSVMLSHYSDISDDDYAIPSSQKRSVSFMEDSR